MEWLESNYEIDGEMREMLAEYYPGNEIARCAVLEVDGYIAGVQSASKLKWSGIGLVMAGLGVFVWPVWRLRSQARQQAAEELKARQLVGASAERPF